MTTKLLRGRTLSFHAEPQAHGDDSCFTYETDGAILIENGLIKATGRFDALKDRARGAQVIDHRPHLLMPGFVDAHIHFPQMQIMASWGAQLLDWLNDYTFPEECRFEDPAHARRMANRFFDELTRHGTTTAAAFCSVHKTSAEAFFIEAARRNMRVVGGKVMMDRNAPDALCDMPQSSYDESKALIADWHGKGRASYAITPRFAITSTVAQLDMAGALAQEHPGCHIQTHLSENRAEIETTLGLFPEAKTYLDVYQRHGLLTDRSLLGHSIHLSDGERGAIAEAGAHPVFCPTSNLFLGSGLFDDAGLRALGTVNAIATDVGAGTSYSMLQTLNEGYKILQLQGQPLHPYRAFHWITRGNAIALDLEDKIGTLAPGSEADIVVLNAHATEAMSLRMDRATSLAEELFVLQMMGDDRAVAETYVAGEAALATASAESAGDTLHLGAA